jgi:two-component system phosphate regulon sensor histidine kinase PhoR
MKNRHLRVIIVWGSLVLGCLIVVQVYWFTKAFNVAEKQFDHNVQMALKRVADSVSNDSEIKKLSSNFFFVDTHTELNDAELNNLLKQEFKMRDLGIHYELGIYRADDDTLVYGNYIEATQKQLLRMDAGLPRSYAGEKNFAVYFPKKISYVAAQLDIWIFSTIILLLMMGFFAYAIASLLRERRFAELKNDFVNNMTHEFKTPVTNINIAAEVLRQKFGHLDGAGVYLDIVLKENDKLRHKIEQVLTGSKLEFQNRPAFTSFDVHELIKDCAEAFQLKLRQRNGALNLELNAESKNIIGDRELLAQAINNIIDNAEKYSPNDPRITVRTIDNGRDIEIQVIDNGIGITSDARKRVFDKFFRVPTGNVHSVKGFGLGLTFVKSVIDKHRGQVQLCAGLTMGTEVRITLPKA